MISFNQTKSNQTKWMQRRLGLVGLTAGAALAATTLSAIANPQSLEKSPSMSGNSQLQQPAVEVPVAPTTQISGTPAPASPISAPSTPTVPTTPSITAPSITAPSMTAPSITAPSMTAPSNPTSTTPMQMPTSPTSPVKPTLPGTSATPTTPANHPAAQTPTSPTTTPRTATANGTIADVAAANSTFKTLVSALNEAELTEVLKGQGPFTVFAPTDAAFNALPAGTVDELMKPENRATLVQLLKYHVVSGDYPSSRLAAGQLPSTEGSPITVTVANGKMKVNNANVLQPDITATNGVIHAIDQVMLPPSR